MFFALIAPSGHITYCEGIEQATRLIRVGYKIIGSGDDPRELARMFAD
ncbi:hypothetical protein SAMN05192534_1489 [Alteribacillus persepolensis]|uniref:Uncharacterized protein n=1 Tax=Alteribacillus persepolensis TaxID=568899 RepID=A0A1G8ICG4_9BACI|nr:hypothetical protein [Alteribacillus persepolensis]SDI16708.1 hypothetical protein SAMN05192534_12392 [Alteribacillus persepolensis]SDI42470.1 hypothetical protein SAMN05192534_1489 [Alteribacillus persepolensis]